MGMHQSKPHHSTDTGGSNEKGQISHTHDCENRNLADDGDEGDPVPTMSEANPTAKRTAPFGQQPANRIMAEGIETPANFSARDNEQSIPPIDEDIKLWRAYNLGPKIEYDDQALALVGKACRRIYGILDMPPSVNVLRKAYNERFEKGTVTTESTQPFSQWLCDQTGLKQNIEVVEKLPKISHPDSVAPEVESKQPRQNSGGKASTAPQQEAKKEFPRNPLYTGPPDQIWRGSLPSVQESIEIVEAWHDRGEDPFDQDIHLARAAVRTLGRKFRGEI